MATVYRELNKPKNIELALITIASVVFFILIANTTRPPFYDEDEYLLNVKILQQYGLGTSYLLKLIGSAGPLFSIIHYIFEPLTHLQAPYVRLINYFFLLGSVYFIGQILKNIGTTTWSYATYIMAIPLTYVMGGLALTEMPALFFYCIGIYAALRSADNLSNFRRAIIYAVIGGLCLSLAIIGRQPYLLTLAAFPLLFISIGNFKRSVMVLLVFLVFALIIPLTVFWIWQGLVPPEDGMLYKTLANNGVEFQPQFVFNFLFYVAIVFLLIAPGFYRHITRERAIKLFVVFILLLTVNFFFHLFLFSPIKTILKSFLSFSEFRFAEVLFGALTLLIGGYCFILLLQNAKQLSFDRTVVFFVVAIILLAISCGKITWGFSSRYTAQAIPLIIGLGSYFYKSSKWNIFRISLGIIIGLASISFHYLGKF